jgi:hypothetical protein
VGAIAVAVSLLFVVCSLNQNTAATHGSTVNIICEIHAALPNWLKLNPTPTETLVKMCS